MGVRWRAEQTRGDLWVARGRVKARGWVEVWGEVGRGGCGRSSPLPICGPACGHVSGEGQRGSAEGLWVAG